MAPVSAVAHTHDFLAVASRPLFHVGSTQITLLRLGALILLLTGCWLLNRIVERGLMRASARSGAYFTQSGAYAVSRISRYIVWIVGTLAGVSLIGFDITAFALAGGAIGVGIGLGLQNLFNNLIAGVILLLEKTLKIGDFVELESGVRGVVREISMRYTRITTNDAVDIVVPNSEFISGRVVNWTLDNPLRRLHVEFGVAYGVDKDLVREAGIAAARSIDATLEDREHPIEVWLTQFGDSSLVFELVVWIGVSAVKRPNSIQAAYLWAIETELRRRNLEIPFPQRDLHWRSGTIDVRLARAAEPPPET